MKTDVSKTWVPVLPGPSQCASLLLIKEAWGIQWKKVKRMESHSFLEEVEFPGYLHRLDDVSSLRKHG